MLSIAVISFLSKLERAQGKDGWMWREAVGQHDLEIPFSRFRC